MSHKKHSEKSQNALDFSGEGLDEKNDIDGDGLESFFDEMADTYGLFDSDTVEMHAVERDEQDDIALVMAALDEVDARATPARKKPVEDPVANIDTLLEGSDRNKPKPGSRPAGMTMRVIQGNLPARDREDPARKALIDRLSLPKELRGPRTVDEVDAGIAELYISYPWASEALRIVMRDARRGQIERGPFLSFRPILLHGRPGCGKTSLGREIAAQFNLPIQVIEGATLTASFRIAGAERSWKSAVPGDPVTTIANHGCANPVILFDEIDKISPIGNGSDPLLAALGLLEPDSARKWKCAYSELDLDMSRINWILTANDISQLPQPVLDRCHVVEIPLPGREHLEALLTEILNDVEDSDVLVREILRRAGSGSGSLRRMMRMVDSVRAALDTPVLH